MLDRPTAAKANCAEQASFLEFLLLAVVLSSLLTIGACSGLSTAAPSSNAQTPVSSTSLTISGALPSGTVGSSYHAILTVSGGTAPYIFSLKSGGLPDGVVLGQESGTLSGTPTAAGTFNFALAVSDSTGLSKQQSFQLSVINGTGTNSGDNGGTLANSFSNLQRSAGWASYGQGPPDFIDCSPSPCDGITFSMQQGISSPSTSGLSTQYNLGGTADYTDALFNNHLIGAFSSQGMPDNNHTLVPTYHDFTYDVYFYGTNLELSQAVEFDINQFFNGQGFIWGHECRIAGGHEWDIWDNVNVHWIPTGIACNPVDNSWNHVTIRVQRTPENRLLYESITLNGVTNQVNQHYDPDSAPSDWYGITINYQMDGNYQQSPYSVYLDDLTFWYQ
ncbi:MAG: Ig domain-containing protein [Candidatus Sulfotelmatobacter sp.]